jgi:hypothetical protein
MTIRSNNMLALPLWAAIVPFVTFNVCYLIAASLEHVPACFPYLSGCTSVSSAGRMAPESLILRAGMLPTAVVLALFWYRCSTFLELGGLSGLRLVTLRVLGLIVALSLVIYAVTLGFDGDVYRQLRRSGINGFALSTFLAQVLLMFSYRHMRIAATEKLWRWLVALCLALPLFGIAAELAKWAGVPRHAANNIVAWNSFVAASAYYAVVARIWWHHGFVSRFEIRSSGRPTSPSE